MKKLMIFLAGFTSLATAASAQIGIAPEIGVNFANMRGQQKYGSYDEKFKGGTKIGIKAGANVNINIADRLQIQPGLFYSIKGYKQGSEQNFDNGLYLASTKENLTLHFVELPINLQYMFNDPGEGRFFIGIGGYVALAFSGKDIVKGNTTTKIPPTVTVSSDTTFHPKFGNDAPSNDLRRFDFGAQANVGYQLRSGIFFRVAYQLGLSNLLPQGNKISGDESTLRTSCITASLGYTLGYKK